MHTDMGNEPGFSNVLRMTAFPARLTPIREGGHLITLAMFPPTRQPYGIFPTVVWEQEALPPSVREPAPGRKVYEGVPTAFWGCVRTTNGQVAPAHEIRRLLHQARVKASFAAMVCELLPRGLYEPRPSVQQDLVAVMVQTVAAAGPAGAEGLDRAVELYQNQIRLVGSVVKATTLTGNHWALTLFVRREGQSGGRRDFPVVRYQGTLPFAPAEARRSPFHLRPWVEVRGQVYTVNYETTVAQGVERILQRANQLADLEETLQLLGSAVERKAWLVRQEIRVDSLELLLPARHPARPAAGAQPSPVADPDPSVELAELLDGAGDLIELEEE